MFDLYRSIARILDGGLASLRGRWGRASPSLYLFVLKSWHLLSMIFTKIGNVELDETPYKYTSLKLLVRLRDRTCDNTIRSSEAMCY